MTVLMLAAVAGIAIGQASAHDEHRLQGFDVDSPKVTALRISEPILLDGFLNENSWGQAQPASRFLQKDPREGEPASEATEVRVLYDTRHIYFGVNCFDSDVSGIRATELRRDNSLESDDIFEFILDTFHDHRSGYLFRINALGTQYDATITDEGQNVSGEWDEKWEVRTQLTQTGWVAEIVIPFKILRFSRSSGFITWGINFHRNIKRKNEDVFWTAHNRNYRFTEVSRAGHLLGLSDIQGFRLRIKPYVTAGSSRIADVSEPQHPIRIGLEDVKYMITPQLALDLTVEPDFAQAEVDQAQVNLTRFSLFFPEKREFFQEGSGIFGFGEAGSDNPEVLLFHSRRIGLSANREEIPIRAGLKLTGKQGPLEIGLLNMQTGRSGDAPGQNFTVLRAKGNLLRRSYVGAIFTRKTAGQNQFSSRAGGVDANFTFFQSFNIQGFIARNDAPLGSDKEWGRYGKAKWDSDRFEFEWEHVDLEENFVPQLGFVARAEPNWTGIKRNRIEAAYKPRPAIGWIRQFVFSSEIDRITNQQGRLDTKNIEFGWSTDFQSGDALRLDFSRNFERLVQPLRIEGGSPVPAGEYRFNQYSLTYSGFSGRPAAANVRVQTGGLYNGEQQSLEVSPQLRPSQNFSINLEYAWNRIRLPGTSAFQVKELNTSVNYSFNERWLTRATILLNSQDKEYAVNFRLNYIFRPGDDLFVIYNEGRTYGPEGQVQNRAIIIKATFSFDF